MNWQETLELHLLHAITIYNYCQVVRITWNATKQHLRQKALCSHQAGAVLPTIAYVYILDESAASQAGQKQQKPGWWEGERTGWIVDNNPPDFKQFLLLLPRLGSSKFVLILCKLTHPPRAFNRAEDKNLK